MKYNAKKRPCQLLLTQPPFAESEVLIPTRPIVLSLFMMPKDSIRQVSIFDALLTSLGKVSAFV